MKEDKAKWEEIKESTAPMERNPMFIDGVVLYI